MPSRSTPEGLLTGTSNRRVHRLDAAGSRPDTDRVAVEEPLELRLEFADSAGQHRRETIAITMRTPGNDPELAAGFLFTEGILASADDIADMAHVGEPVPPHGLRNVVRVALAPGTRVSVTKLERNFYITSSCGVCGKTSLEALEVQRRIVVPPDSFRIRADTLFALPQELMSGQGLFDATGGIHAAATFDAAGAITGMREDVGRHNALDKLVGAMLLDKALPLLDKGILVSGRASFELLQKAMMAGCPMLAAVGAPSSLAVDVAEKFGITLVGFLRDGRANVYSGAHRIH